MNSKEYQRIRKDKLAKYPDKDKLQCLICKNYYKRVCSHVRQRHGMNAREYKKEFGLDNKKGLMTEQARETMKKHTEKNRKIVIDRNLLIGGVKTRYKKGDNGIGTYERSSQSKKRLSKLYTLTKVFKNKHKTL